MRKGDKITGNKGTYTILKDFEVTGGMSKVTTGILDTDKNTYFIKEFLSPKYPGDKNMSGSSATIKKRIARCELFENHHNKINKEIAKKSSIGGNLISAFDFFRSGTTYYKVSENVDINSISISEVSRIPVLQRLLIIRTIVSSLKILHDLEIVHGDLKQDNILLKKVSDEKYVSKLIDFDNSYFSSNPPLNSEEVIGTQEYYSPELGKYITGSDDIKAKDLTTQSDIFALGILFSEYWCGEKPIIEKKYRYIWQQILDGKKVLFNGRIPIVLQELIEKMLSKNPKERPTISEIISIFRSHDVSLYERKESKVEPAFSTGDSLKVPTLEPTFITRSTLKEPIVEPIISTGSALKGKLIDKISGAKSTESSEKIDEPEQPRLRGKLLK